VERRSSQVGTNKKRLVSGFLLGIQEQGVNYDELLQM